MVMTRQQPFMRHQPRKISMQQSDEYGEASQRATASSSAGGGGGARRVTTPPTAAAAASQKKTQEGVSLYEELLRYHEENPDDEDARKIEQFSVEEEDRKPAARPANGGGETRQTQKKSKNGIYRVPVSREYFAARDRMGSPGSSHHNNQSANSPDQQSTSDLADWEDPRLVQGSLAAGLHELPMPFLDSDFHDTAEDEALARRLQAEEEERAAANRRAAFTANVAMPSRNHDAYRESQLRYSRESSTSFRGMNPSDVVPATLVESNKPENHPRGGSARTIASRHRHHPDPGNVVAEFEIAKQEGLLQNIKEENERKQLQWALKESERAAVEDLTTRSREVPHVPGITDVAWGGRNHSHSLVSSPPMDWEERQKAALEEYGRQRKEISRQSRHRHNTTGHMDLPSPSEARRSPPRKEELLLRGQEETAKAVRSGQALLVKCQSCSRRLQAPAHYSLVYCPKCGNVSPVKPVDKR